VANSPWAGRRREVPAQPSRQGARATDAGTYVDPTTPPDAPSPVDGSSPPLPAAHRAASTASSTLVGTGEPGTPELWSGNRAALPSPGGAPLPGSADPGSAAPTAAGAALSTMDAPSQAAGTNQDPAVHVVPGSTDLGDGAPSPENPSSPTSQRGLFALRGALKSAMRVLTMDLRVPLGGGSIGEAAAADAGPLIDGGEPGETPWDDGTDPREEAWGEEVGPDASEDLGGQEGLVAGQESAGPVVVAPSLPPGNQGGLSGHTSTVAVPEVLGFLAQLRKTGTMWIWNERELYRVQLVDGNVTFARNETPQQGSLLGEILVAHGHIDPDALEEFFQAPRAAGPMGDALVKAGLITQAALNSAIQFQAQRVFNRAYGLGDAHFRFDAGVCADCPSGIRISVTHMLFESARERDESAQRLEDVFDDPFAQ
jgi:hypothetical protein